ncbi:MAG: holin [Clostridiales bacterium]|nr:holin [Clostridiales bacterium]
MAQSAVAAIGTTAYFFEVNWLAVLSAAVLGGLMSLLTSLAGLPEVSEE